MGNKSKRQGKKSSNSRKKAPSKKRPQQITVNGLKVPVPESLQVATGLEYAADKLPPLSAKPITEATQQAPESVSRGKKGNTPEMKALVDIATHLWRMQGRVLDRESKEPKEGFERIAGDLERMANVLKEVTVEVIDPVGEPYDSGMAMKVINFEPTPGFSSETILETIKPRVNYDQHLVQWPEVIVGTPMEANHSELKGESDEQNND